MRGRQRRASDETMKKAEKSADEIRPEYEFSKMKGGVRGKYAKRYRAGTNLVKIDPDVAEVFGDDSSVNEALRSLIRVARQRVKLAR